MRFIVWIRAEVMVTSAPINEKSNKNQISFTDDTTPIYPHVGFVTIGDKYYYLSRTVRSFRINSDEIGGDKCGNHIMLHSGLIIPHPSRIGCVSTDSHKRGYELIHLGEQTSAYFDNWIYYDREVIVDDVLVTENNRLDVYYGSSGSHFRLRLMSGIELPSEKRIIKAIAHREDILCLLEGGGIACFSMIMVSKSKVVGISEVTVKEHILDKMPEMMGFDVAPIFTIDGVLYIVTCKYELVVYQGIISHGMMLPVTSGNSIPKRVR